MNKNIKIAKELIAIAKTLLNKHGIEIDEKLYNIKTKQGAKNYIRNSINNLIKGHFKDQDWSHVKNVFDAINMLGVNLNWYVEKGGYAIDQSSKTYKFDIEYTNVYGEQMKFKGQLICCFCGTVDDPMSQYDMVFQIF